ncbi:hypothetical protein HPB48_002979 [Haemaphysalis longicornis]|uniref:Endonuclease/exonuclease/phosphatase domain-containing protein n=1 Tax=Haemaphysalis longicornis TaxID=44386 RepID=A0A9J6FDW9_HAELO|nr:hypothetical protein HPB48_002979 [Haemaphysalis longicornis]
MAIQHSLKQSGAIDILLEIIPQAHKKTRSLCFLNVYCRPKSSPLFISKKLNKRHSKQAWDNPLVITGDFNLLACAATHTQTQEALRLYWLMESQDLTIVTDHRRPTRIGTSLTRDTAPDLTLTKNVPQGQ